MNQLHCTSVLAYWYGRPLTARATYAQICEYLTRLRTLSDVFDKLYAMDQRGYTALRSDLSNLEAELAASVNPERAFINADPADKKFAITSHSMHGFRAYLTNCEQEELQTVVLGITCGQMLLPGQPMGTPNSVRLSIAPEIETPELLRTLLEQTVAFWRPDDAVISRPAVRDRLNQPIGEVKPGWLTYIADPSVADALPPEIRYRPFADGVLIEAAERPGTEADPDFIASVLRVRDALRPRGLLNMRAALSGIREPAVVAR